MKIAVVDHVGNWGGGSRFARALLLALRKNYPEVEITYCYNAPSFRREGVVSEYLSAGITCVALTSLRESSPRLLDKVICGAANRMPILLSRFLGKQTSLQKEISALTKGHDIAIFPWPFLLEYPDIDCPAVGVFHDFNYKYFFGSKVFSDKQCSDLSRQIPRWLANCKPIVSSKFMAAELSKHYPYAAKNVDVIHLAPFALSSLTDQQARSIIAGMGITQPFIVYPTNLCVHKNLGMLLRALYLLRQDGFGIPLIITGPGTESIRGNVCAFGCEISGSGPNVLGLGYVTNDQIDALVQLAEATVSTSVYEAGNGPGLEAWLRGTPVVMSNIPAFTEHMEVLGVTAHLFDPYNAHDIARAIRFVLNNREVARSSAQLSKSLIERYTWDIVARRYYDVLSALT